MARPAHTDQSALLMRLLDAAKTAGATDAEASISCEEGFSVGVRHADVETLEHHHGQDLHLTVYKGLRTASVSSSDLSDGALISMAEKACVIASQTQEDPCAGLAEAAEIALVHPDIPLFDPWDITPAAAIELGKELEAVALSTDKRIKDSESVALSTLSHRVAFANSRGLMANQHASEHYVSLSVLASDANGMQRDHDYTLSRRHDGLGDLNAVAQSAAKKTVARIGAKHLATQRLPILFSPEMAASLIQHFISANSGGSLYRRASFLLNRLGDTIFPDFITIAQHPHLPFGMGSAAVDGDGLLTRDINYIDKGRLASHILGVYSARKLQLKSTANASGVHNIRVSDSGKDKAALLKEMSTGLYVTELMGQGVNMVTGDYSRGAFGYWVENGEIQYPVHEITIAGNLLEMFSRIQAIGSDVDFRGNIHVGSILVDAMSVAGQ